MTTLAEAAPVHVVFGVDAGYYRGMGVAIASVVNHNPGRQFVFHVFAFTASEDSRRRMQALERQIGMPVRLHLLDPESLRAFRQFPCFAQHSLGTFIRLLIPGRMRETASTVLYLDADLLCFGALDELLATDVSQVIAAAAPDEALTTVSTQVAALELRHGRYFNAGVMLINVEQWMAHGVEQTALEILSSRPLRFADQDALNIALDGRTRYIDDKWNTRYHLVDYLSRGETRLALPQRPPIVHFTGPVKPWQDWCLHEARQIFVDLQATTPWADVALDLPRSPRELKLFSKFLIRQRRTVEGVLWHLKYLGARFVSRVKAGWI